MELIVKIYRDVNSGFFRAATTITEKDIFGSSDTVSGALRNLASAIIDGRFEAGLLTAFVKEP